MNKIRLFAMCLCPMLVAIGACAQTVYIVRHAEKAGIDNEPNPPLSDVGKKRADDLARTLASVKLRAIYVTEYRRTQETAAPIAKARNLVPNTIKATEIEALAGSIKTEHVNDAVLVVGHSNLPLLLKALGVKDSIVVDESDYDDLFILDRINNHGGFFHHLHYGDTSHLAPSQPASK